MVIDGRRTAGSALTGTEARRIVRLIRPDLDRYAATFDAQKYPPTTYQRLLNTFHTPSRTTAADVRLAILWKFGHLGKARIPAHHERLILELQQNWPEVASVLLGPTRKAFARLTAMFGSRYRYITVSFLAHLLRPRDVPIIDQHNFRAMNYYISTVRPGWRSKARPSAYEDLALLAAFIRSVRATWKALDPSTHPSQRTLDQFLMMFGKRLKGRSKLPNNRLEQPATPASARALGGGGN